MEQIRSSGSRGEGEQGMGGWGGGEVTARGYCAHCFARPRPARARVPVAPDGHICTPTHTQG